jgi:hypothetical protein
MAATAAVMGSIGLVVVVLVTIAAIDTWTDVNDARRDFAEAQRHAQRKLEDFGVAAGDAMRRAQIEREIEKQGIQLVEFPEPVEIPEPPTFLEEAGGEILVAVIAGAFVVSSTLLARGSQLDQVPRNGWPKSRAELPQARGESARA